MNNPLLDFSGLPRFDRLQPGDVEPAITVLLQENRQIVERLAQSAEKPHWSNFVAPLSEACERLSRAWGIVSHLHSVNDIPAWREAYNAQLPEVTRFWSELGQDLRLFEKYKALQASPDFTHLSLARQKIVDNEIRDFRLSGAELAEAQKPRFQEIQEELAALAAKFAENLLDATNAFAEQVTDPAELHGLPADVIEAARMRAEQNHLDGWVFTLHAPSYVPVLQYAESRRLREKMYRALAVRAAEFDEFGSKPEWNNAPLICRLLELKREQAQMLGYADYAEVSLVRKMAQTTDEVLVFLRELGRKAKPYAEKDWAALKAFAARELGFDSVESWDLAFIAEKLKKARYDFSDEEVKQYFPEHKVLEGLFWVIETLFGVRVRPDEAVVWHPDVHFFRLEKEDGALIGQFYLDLYARETKRGGAWMDDAITRRRRDGSIQTPVAYLCCNFPAPLADADATFSHNDVITLFHESGHGLHHLLTQVDELEVSGINGVEWDAVELPSQFMENFCWEWGVLAKMTEHTATGESLPRPLYDKMVAARNFGSGMQMVRQLEFSLFDMLLHSAPSPNYTQVAQLLDDVRREIAVIIPPPWYRFPNSFSHIFAGGYAAGYYSYKWAEVLSADAFAAFEEAAEKTGSALDPETGRRFYEEILAVGGSRSAMSSFTKFRKRPPCVDALLRHNGMSAP